MIEGHGDDLYKYSGIVMNFSSNIYARADLSALQQHLCSRMDVIRTYPEPSALSLERLIARQFGISPDQVLVASGAVDAIYLIAQCYRHLGTCHVVQPTFSEYADACRTFGYHETPDGAVCWLCNPNNPTGNILPPDKVIALADAHHLLVVDQSYEDYTLQPVLQPADVVDRDNIIVLHSMTKRYAVPGLRLGFVTADVNGEGIIAANESPLPFQHLKAKGTIQRLDYNNYSYRNIAIDGTYRNKLSQGTPCSRTWHPHPRCVQLCRPHASSLPLGHTVAPRERHVGAHDSQFS